MSRGLSDRDIPVLYIHMYIRLTRGVRRQGWRIQVSTCITINSHWKRVVNISIKQPFSDGLSPGDEKPLGQYRAFMRLSCRFGAPTARSFNGADMRTQRVLQQRLLVPPPSFPKPGHS